MGSGKKFGGVKNTRGVKSSGVSPTPTKKIAGVKTIPRGAPGSTVESCPENCPGEFVRGRWIHSSNCPWVAVIWKFHGGDINQWRCPYDCDPVCLPSGWTHYYACPYWSYTGKTPFDQTPPPEDTPIQSAMESTQIASFGKRSNSPSASEVGIYSGSVKQQKERIRKGYSSTVNTKSLMDNIRDFEKFPEALEPEDDGLPF